MVDTCRILVAAALRRSPLVMGERAAPADCARPRRTSFHQPRRAASMAAETIPLFPERRTEMLLLQEALARAQCSDRLAEAEARRARQRMIRAARARRQLETALRRLERAEQAVQHTTALAQV